MKTITDKMISDFLQYLIEQEKSSVTQKQYVYNIVRLSDWAGERELDKQLILEYKQYLYSIYKTAGVNANISAINSFFEFLGKHELKVKSVKKQKEIFVKEEQELNKNEYERLLTAAYNSNNFRLYYIMQTLCSTGIRISELKYITVESVKNKMAEVSSKGKLRIILLSNDLCQILTVYIQNQKIKQGSIFVTKTGNPIDRSNVWSDMKKLCNMAKVSEKKVFPHNFRHLFARTYYSCQKDIVRLADILGHSSIDTTRIYTIESGKIHREQLEKLGLTVKK